MTRQLTAGSLEGEWTNHIRRSMLFPEHTEQCPIQMLREMPEDVKTAIVKSIELSQHRDDVEEEAQRILEDYTTSDPSPNENILRFMEEYVVTRREQI